MSAPTPTRRPSARRLLLRTFPWILILGGSAVAMGALGAGRLVEQGRPAPALTAVTAEGQRFELPARTDEVIVLNFWATWCPPCRAEAPALARVHQALQAMGGTVLGVSADDGDVGAITRAARELGMPYPIAKADASSLERYQVTQLPTTYVVAEGRIVWSALGEVDEAELLEVVRRHAR